AGARGVHVLLGHLAARWRGLTGQVPRHGGRPRPGRQRTGQGDAAGHRSEVRQPQDVRDRVRGQAGPQRAERHGHQARGAEAMNGRLTAALALLAWLCPAASAGTRAVGPVGLADVKWTEGFWADRFATCRDVMIPALGEVMAGTKHSQFLENFRIAAGLSKGRHRGPPWNDGDLYKWLEAAPPGHAVSPRRQLAPP